MVEYQRIKCNKNVTANYLETSYILFFHNFTIYKERFDFVYKDKYNF